MYNYTDPGEVKLLKKECFNRWYGLVPYYAALTLSRLPFQVSAKLHLLLKPTLYMLKKFKYGNFTV